MTAADANYNTWYADLWERTTMGLDLDFMKGKKFTQKLMLKGAASSHDEGGESTSAKRLSLDCKVLKQLAPNMVAVSVTLLESEDNRRCVGTFRCICMRIAKWERSANKRLRGSQANRDWLVEQIAERGYMAHLEDLLSALSSKEDMSSVGLVVTSEAAMQCSNADIIDEDFWADFFGQTTMHALAARGRRGASLTHGWPNRMHRSIVLLSPILWTQAYR